MSSFRRDAVALITLSAVTAVAVVSFLSNVLFRDLIDDVESSRFELMRAVLQTALSDAENKALARAQMIADLPTVQRAVAAGDRAAVLAETEVMFAHQKDRFGVDQAQFTVLPAVSLLRLNAPEKFGDDLSSFRPIVVEANSKDIALKSPALSRSGPAIIGIAPVHDATAGMVGSFEVGIDYGSLLQGLSTNYQLDGALFIEEEPLKAIATGVGGDVLTPENRVGRFIRFTTTHVERMSALVTDRDLSSGDETHYVGESAGVPYGVVLLPVQTFSGKKIGAIAVASDFSGSRAASTRTAVWQALIALVAGVLIAGIVQVVVRGVLLRPLGALDTKLAALAAGDTSQAGDTSDTQCDELVALNKSYEALRAKAGA